MTTLLQYTYKDDAQLTLISVKQAMQAFPCARMVIIDDQFNPMPKDVTTALQAIGATIEYSTHHRQGNLIGHEHALFHAQTMARLCPNDDDIVIKFDPDTLLFSNKWLNAFTANKDAVLAGAFKSHISYLMGLVYAVKGSIVKAYLDDVSRFPAWVKAFEDFEVGSRIYRLTNADPFAIMRHDINGRDGWMLINFMDAPKCTPQIQNCSVFNGGFMDKGNPQMKAQLIGFMKMLCDKRNEKEIKK